MYCHRNFQTNAYNGLDDRVTATSASTAHRFVFDGDGRVLGEYGASATAVTAETIWLTPQAANNNQFGGDDGVGGYAPLAVGTGTGAGAAIIWLHGNHLGVPIAFADATGAAIAAPAYTLPGFPGQLKTLSDIYYNRYRDYDSSTGRYIQADPIGLGGGSNLYLYAGANPLRYTDPDGRNPLIIGAVIGIGIELGRQAFMNWYDGRDVLEIDCYNWTEVAVAGVLGAVGGQGYKWFKYGKEFRIGKSRIAPFGNRNPSRPPNSGDFPSPHYHRPGPKGSDGNPLPGQGVGRHRPWESSAFDKSFWDRF